jgi:tetratricopeptide (TPR) repeat protein
MREVPMNTISSNILAEIQTLLEKRDYVQAEVLFRAVESQGHRRWTTLERSEYNYLYARYYHGVGEYKKALRMVESALKLSREMNNDSLYASQKRLLGVILMECGELTNASEEFLESYAFCRRAGETTNLYKVVVDLSLAHFLKGNLFQALYWIDEARQSAHKYGNQEAVRRCELNKARFLIFTGGFEKSASILQSYSERADMEEYLKAFVLQSFGILNVFMWNKNEAARNLNDSLTRYEKLMMQREQIICKEYLGRNEFFAGNYKDAERIYREILNSKEITASARGQTLRFLSELYIAEDDFDKAIETAKKAEKAIKDVGEQIEFGALYRAWGQIYAYKGDKDQAQNYFQKSISLLRTLGAHYELALSYLAYGCSELHGLEEHIHFLRIAGDLFVEMGVAKRVEQVNKQLDILQSSAHALGKVHKYDVFLCYNSKDGSVVEEIAKRLKGRGFRVWLDKWELQPGLSFSHVTEELFERIESAAVFVGKSGTGPWQDLEQETFLRQLVRTWRPVIPVLLRNCPKKPRLPRFLEAYHWVDFRKSSPDPMENLIWGITGIRPIDGTNWALGARIVNEIDEG